jgi:hypothetical protein
MPTDTIQVDTSQAQAPPDTSSVAVAQLSTGQRVVGPRENLPALLRDDPGAKELPLGTDQVAVRLSNGHVAIGPKTNLLNLQQDDPGVRIVAGTLNNLPSRAGTPEQQKQLDDLTAEPQGATGFATGIAKGAVETMRNVLNLAGKTVGKENAGDEALSVNGRSLDTKAANTSQTLGKVGESILEFVTGDEALKGLSLAERLGVAHRLAKLVEGSSVGTRALEIGETALRQGAVSGAQTIAKGGTPTQAGENAAITAAVSATFGAAGAGASALYQSLAARSPKAIAAAIAGAEKEGTDLAESIAGGKLGTAHEVAQDVSDQLAKASDQMHADYAQGLAEIGQKAQGIRVPLAGSPLQKTAQTMLSDSSVPAEIQTAMKGVIPDAARLNPLLEEIATSPGDYSWEQMEATRQTIGQTIRKLPADSPLRPDLIRLRGAVDDTMSKAAADSGNADVAQSMANLRSAYASKIQAFESNAIKSLAGNSPDSVANALLNKQSVFNVNTLRSIIGADNMRPVEGSLLQRLVDNASTSGEFNPKSFVSSFNRLGPDVQKAIWADNLPAVKNFLNTASNVPTASPIWSGLARYMEHRAIFDAAVGTALFGAGALAGHFSGQHLLGPAALLAGIVALHNQTVLGQATNILKLGAAAAAPIAAGTAVEENSEPATTLSNSSEQLRPGLLFHPGAGIPKP